MPPIDLPAGQQLIVTGATGFLGSAFVRHAVEAAARVTIVSRASADHWRLAEVAGRYQTVVGALDALDNLLPLETPGAVMVHFAAAGVNQTYDDVREMVRTNVQGTLSALRYALRSGAARFVLVGSSGEYGAGVALTEHAPLRPTSEYGATRASATLLARAFGDRRGLDVVVVRPFAVYGPYEPAYRLIPHAIQSAQRGQPIRISSGQQTRDYVHVDDVSAGVARACMVEAARGGTFNLSTGVETTVRRAAEIVARIVGSGVPVTAGAVPAIPGEMWRTSGDPARARVVLGWTAGIDLETGVARTVSWYRERGLALLERPTRPLAPPESAG